MKRLSLLLLAALSATTLRAESAGPPPTILHVSSGAAPGETVLLTGDWPAEAEVEIAPTASGEPAWRRIHPAQGDAEALKFTFPTDLPIGAYRCRVVAGSQEPSAPVMLNLPDPWWLQGDGGSTSAAPGGWLRVFGKALHFEAGSRLRLSAGARTTVLEARAADGYSLSTSLPKDLAAGDYVVSVHNGFGGDEGWVKVGRLRIDPATVWKQDVFDVTAMPSVAGKPRPADWTLAVKAALAKAAANGGGVVYFPRGRYALNEEIKVPLFVTLRGEGEGLVSLFWPPREAALPSLISGGDNFAVEDLSIYTNGIHRDAISGQNNLRVERVRIRCDAYYRHDFVGKAHAVKAVTISSSGMGCGVRISGDNPLVADCDIYHSTSAIEMYHTRGGVIARNRLDYGQGPMQVYGISQVVIEDNDCSSASLWASGIGLSLYHEACANYHVYFARNHIRQNLGGDREAVTLDGHGTAFIGAVTAAAGLHITLEGPCWWGSQHKDMIPVRDFERGIERKRSIDDPDCEWHGVTLYILKGRGAGQYRNVLSFEDNEVDVDLPWAVPPDETSIVSIGKFNGRMLFVGNEFRDAGTAVQLYPPNCDNVVAGNQLWRVESLNCGAELGRRLLGLVPPEDGSTYGWRVEPSWFNEFLDNHIWEGNGWAGGTCRLSIGGTGVIQGPVEDWLENLPISRGHIVRGNQLENNATIFIQGEVRDAVVERNFVADSEQGIVVQAKRPAPGGPPTIPPQGILLEGNRFKAVGSEIVIPADKAD